MQLSEIKDQIEYYHSQSLADFNKRIISTPRQIIGVKIPELRKIAKIISKQEPLKFLNENDFSSFELEMLHGLVIGSLEENLSIVLEEIEKFIPQITNWAVMDSFCQSLKITKNYKEEMWNFISEYSNSTLEFELRFVVVMMMTYYLDDEHIDMVLDYIDNKKNDAYYYKMSVAWCIATIVSKNSLKGISYLENCNLDDWTYNKAIQKCVESLKINNELTLKLKKMKRGTK